MKRLELDHDMPAGNLRRALSALHERAEQLEHLGASLGDLCSRTQGRPTAEEIRHAATGIRANATHAILMAANAVELAGRLDTIAAILESDQKR